MKKITPRISESATKFYEETFRTIHAGAEQALSFYPFLYKYTTAELSGIFTPEELYYLVDIYNGIVITETNMHLRQEIVIATIEDAAKFDGTAEKWQINIKKLINKIKNLTSAQIYFLQELIINFWEKKSSQEDALKKFAKEYANENK